MPLRSRKIFAGKIRARFAWAFTTFPFLKNGIPNMEIDSLTRVRRSGVRHWHRNHHTSITSVLAAGVAVAAAEAGAAGMAAAAAEAAAHVWQQQQRKQQRTRRLKHGQETRARNRQHGRTKAKETWTSFKFHGFPVYCHWFLAGEFPTSFRFQIFLESSNVRSETPKIQK